MSKRVANPAVVEAQGDAIKELNSKLDQYDPSTQEPITNCNTTIETGNYHVYSTTANIPASDTRVLEVLKRSTTVIFQNGYATSGKIYTRCTTDGGTTWTTWEELALNSKTTFLRITGTLGASGEVKTIYTHSTNLMGYMIVGWDVTLDNVKYAWADQVVESVRIDGSSVKVKHNSSAIEGQTMEVLLYKIPT